MEKLWVSKKTGVIILLGSVLLMLVIGLLLPPIPQSQSYHNFADQRSWLGINNAFNVLSNLSFALIGIWGLFLLFSHSKIQFIDSSERWFWVSLSLGLILVALGSGYYHLVPDNSRLVWDRLPMTIVFISFVSALISDRINSRLAFWLWPFLLMIGIFSVLQWHVSELHGAGDLRLYAAVQAYTCLLALIMLLLQSHYTRSWDIAIITLFYGLAKAFELYDAQIYQFCRGIISGHTLKHLTAALSAFWMIRMIWKRQIL
ncbi:hypothetical protein BN59_01523 [Legionella massiliensis]|uniref:Ceramidase n=1 Tax=Legionella massiliensis TaxID=1034943 RepID=A0A078KW67_9GAMM|nr:hypothetical protein [Legionella massiliensis]CDZ77241.1 hypothetical protein BN59_01523 [Legionella massiliensis]CEE12979.1 hypothetical protein BN1094_01523 [Legionella massiliensis]